MPLLHRLLRLLAHSLPLALFLAAVAAVGEALGPSDELLCRLGQTVVRQDLRGFRYCVWNDEPTFLLAASASSTAPESSAASAATSYRGVQGGAYCGGPTGPSISLRLPAALRPPAASPPDPWESCCLGLPPCGQPAPAAPKTLRTRAAARPPAGPVLYRTPHLYYLRVALLALPLWATSTTSTIAPQWERAAAAVFSGTDAELRGVLATLSPLRVVVLGGGIGVYASSIAHYFAAARITSVEVDANVVEVARRCFSFPPPSSSGIGSSSSKSSSSSTVDGRKANTAGQATKAGSPGTAGGGTHTNTKRRIEVVTADGRSYLDHSVRAGSTDIIFMDAFDGHGERDVMLLAKAGLSIKHITNILVYNIQCSETLVGYYTENWHDIIHTES